jgi:hypothetical protein
MDPKTVENTNHLTSTYTDCNRLRLIDRCSLMKVFKQAVCATDIELLETSELVFANGG